VSRSGTSTSVAHSLGFLTPVVVGNLVQIVTLPVLTRRVPTEDFGAWALATAFALTLGGVAMLGLPTVYERNFFQYGDPRGRATLLTSVLACSAAGLALAGAVTFWWRAPISLWLTGVAGHGDVVTLAFAGFSMTSLKEFFMVYLRSDEDAAGFALFSMADRILTGVFQVALVTLTSLGVNGVIMGQIAASGGVLVVLLVRFSRRMTWTFAWPPLADSLRLSLPMLPRLLVASLSNSVDKYLISHLSSLGAAGVYAIGQRVANLASVYGDAINFVYRPKVYQMMFSEAPDAPVAIGRYLTPFAYVSTLCAFAIAVFSEEALRLVAPGAYYGAIGIATVLSLHYGSLFFGKMPQIFYARKTYWIPILTLGAVVVNGAFVMAGIRWFGPIGAAWGVLGASVLNSIATFLVGQHCYRIEWEGRRLTEIFGAFAAAGLLTLAMRGGGVPYPALLCGKLVITAGYLAVGYRLGIVNAASLATLRAAVVALVGRVAKVRRLMQGKAL
jgi:O-antigen/teichoic acid export membrane protein